MALRDQPYMPLYVQDFLTDEKLIECSAAANGVYIRVMCILHKQQTYGKILLKQKHKQTEQQIKNFASQFARSLPWDLLTIESALNELIQEDVLQIEGDFLCQKRMIRDAEISDARAKSGSTGGKKTKKNFATKFATAKIAANSENEIEDENQSSLLENKRRVFKKPTVELCQEYFEQHNSTTLEGLKFYQFYESKGWKVGKSPMKKWEAAAAGWISRINTPPIKTEQVAPFALAPDDYPS